jgi:autophagy-related protein 18
VTYIEAHKSPLSVIAINVDGTLLATSSDKGTVIRVFSVPGGAKLYQFRRGTYPARIYSLSFNPLSTLLCVSSDTETIHFFRILQTSAIRKTNNSHYNGSGDASTNEVNAFLDSSKQDGTVSGRLRKSSQLLGRSVAEAMGGYLPSTITEMWEPARDFASIRLPTHNTKNVRSVVGMNK